MKRLFLGTFDELKAELAKRKIYGRWEVCDHRRYMMRCGDGAVLTWDEHTGAIWTQGAAAAAARLSQVVSLIVAEFDPSCGEPSTVPLTTEARTAG